MSLENDIIKVRQEIQRLQNIVLDETGKVWATYHDSNFGATPADPVTDGTTGGWHRNVTEDTNWMSTKIAPSASSGTWGTPFEVRGLAVTVDGAGTSKDAPQLFGIEFIGDGSSKVGWTAGRVDYAGNSYAIAGKIVSAGSTDDYIYWDDAGGQTSFKTTTDLSLTYAANHWPVCLNESGVATPAASYKWIIAALLKVVNLAAINADLGSITAGTITLSLGGNTRLRINSSGLYVSNNAGGAWTGVIRNDSGTVILQADILKASEIITSHINNLAVITGKIANDATTIDVFDYNSSTEALDGTYKTIASAVITCTGQTLNIKGGGTMSNTADFWLALYRDAVLLKEVNFERGSGTKGAEELSFIEAPSSGSYTYYLKAKETVGTSITDGFVSVQEFKK